jgi:hypothetical protein
MSGWIANPGAVALLDFLAGNASALETEWARQQQQEFTNRATYLCLLTAKLTDAAITTAAVVGAEASGTGYVRQSVAWGPASATTRTVSNLDPVIFGPFADSGGLNAPVQAAALVTCATGSAGMATMYWELSTPLTTAQNQVVSLPAGQLVMGLATS